MTQEPYATKNQFDRLALKVDIFEKELKVLKAEIQATLLAIQERMLLESYPALRDNSSGEYSRASANQKRQWQVKKFGVGQVSAVPAIYSEDEAPEIQQTPPFYPPIDAEPDPYYPAYDPHPTVEVPRAYGQPSDPPYEQTSNAFEAYSAAEQIWNELQDNGRGFQNGHHSDYRPQSDYSSQRQPSNPSRNGRQERAPQPYQPPSANHNGHSNGNGNGSRPANGTGSPLGEMLERLRASYPPNRQPNGNSHQNGYQQPSAPTDEPTARASRAALQSMFASASPQPEEHHPESLNDVPVADFHVWLELDKWVHEKVQEVGIAGALELARLYGGQEREILLKLITIYDDRFSKTSPPVPSAMPAAPTAQQQPLQPPQQVQPETPFPADKPSWQNQGDADRAKFASYRPFGEHQELVLQLLADVLRSGMTPTSPTNGTQRKR